MHIPIELLAQWNAEFRNFQNREWFKLAYSHEERTRMEAFDELVHIFERSGNDQDVPEVFQDGGWISLRESAKGLVRTIEG